MGNPKARLLHVATLVSLRKVFSPYNAYCWACAQLPVEAGVTDCYAAPDPKTPGPDPVFLVSNVSIALADPHEFCTILLHKKIILAITSSGWQTNKLI